MSGDKWKGMSTEDWELDNPSPADVDEALDRLDASAYTMMSLECPNGRHLMIGGGAGQYVVSATLETERFWVLLRAEPARGTVFLNTGGQEGDFPASQVVAKAQAHQAAHVFLETGEMDEDQQWAET
jgi:hypothetical protein